MSEQRESNGPPPNPPDKLPVPPQGGMHSPVAPGGNPANAPLKGPKEIPADAKGQNPGSMVTNR